jgi:type I restriction enzyme S subunit
MGALGMSEYEGVTSPAYDILRAIRPLNSKFYHYLFRCGLYLPEFKKRSRGIMDMRLRLYFDEFGQILLIYPNPEEQDKIVDYLDQQTAKIDTLIATTQHQIDRLQAYRTALISDAVTGKIDVRTTRIAHKQGFEENYRDDT